MQREIGGYFELERYSGSHYHVNALRLNCGRGCISYVVEARSIKSIWVPRFVCASVNERLSSLGVNALSYPIDLSFQPIFDSIKPSESDYLFLIDYYGQLSEQSLDDAIELFGDRIIVDEAQGFFRYPKANLDTLYTARKYFGVSDGAYLYTDARVNRPLERDESHNRMHYLLGRLERSATEFYGESRNNNRVFDDEPAKRMSAVTESLLSAIDYQSVQNRREQNFAYLNLRLATVNELSPSLVPGPFCYPLLVDNAPAARKKLAERKIYIPVYWPNVLADISQSSTEYYLSNNILPLPVDQRYDTDDMETVINALKDLGIG